MLPDGLLPDQGTRPVAALFLGTALSISSLKIVAIAPETNFRSVHWPTASRHPRTARS